jgi:hypothetical protein
MSRKPDPASRGDIWIDFERDVDGAAAARLLTGAGVFAHYGQAAKSGRPWLLILHNGLNAGHCSCPAAAFRRLTREQWETLKTAIERHHGRIWVGAGSTTEAPQATTG